MKPIDFQSWSPEKRQQGIELLNQLRSLHAKRKRFDDSLTWGVFTDPEQREAFAELQAQIKAVEVQWDELCTLG